MGLFSWSTHTQPPSVPPPPGQSVDQPQPFEQALISAANRILGLKPSDQYAFRTGPRKGADRFDDLPGAASLVVTNICRIFELCDYETHFLHPTVRHPEDAVSAACFVATCLSCIAEILEGRDVPFDLVQAYSRAGSAILQLYDPKDQVSILKSGADLHKHIIESLSQYPSLKKWRESLSTLTLVFIVSPDDHAREHDYLPALRDLYLSLHTVWAKRSPVPNPPTPSST
jgi:hypothetical protein